MVFQLLIVVKVINYVHVTLSMNSRSLFGLSEIFSFNIYHNFDIDTWHVMPSNSSIWLLQNHPVPFQECHDKRSVIFFIQIQRTVQADHFNGIFVNWFILVFPTITT